MSLSQNQPQALDPVRVLSMAANEDSANEDSASSFVTSDNDLISVVSLLLNGCLLHLLVR